jgi:hypothetical protein
MLATCSEGSMRRHASFSAGHPFRHQIFGKRNSGPITLGIVAVLDIVRDSGAHPLRFLFHNGRRLTH